MNSNYFKRQKFEQNCSNPKFIYKTFRYIV